MERCPENEIRLELCDWSRDPFQNPILVDTSNGAAHYCIFFSSLQTKSAQKTTFGRYLRTFASLGTTTAGGIRYSLFLYVLDLTVAYGLRNFIQNMNLLRI